MTDLTTRTPPIPDPQAPANPNPRAPAAPVHPTPAPGQQKTCPNCHAVVADDQSYCLNCGSRLPDARMPVDRPGAPPPEGARRSDGGEPPPRDWTAVIALGGLAVLALVLVIGVLIGKSGNNSAKVAASPSVITVAGGGGTNTTSTSADAGSGTSITEDWPSGKSAWTIQLQTIKKAGATASSVDSAKSAATGKGATGVGLLDGSQYNGIGGDYIIYSGIYDSQAKANAALPKLKKSFSGAKVIHVVSKDGNGGSTSSGGVTNAGPAPSAAQQQAGAAAISTLSNCSGAACSKAARKITQPIATPGASPSTDNKPAGGGSGAQTFQ